MTIAALRIVLAGAFSVPADCFLNTRPPTLDRVAEKKFEGAPRVITPWPTPLGKAKAIIAFELGISVSTVKVHGTNIMKKTQAKNRTEAAINIRAQTNVTAPLISNTNVETGAAVA